MSDTVNTGNTGSIGNTNNDRARNWFFTLDTPTASDTKTQTEKLKKFGAAECKYLIFQPEVGDKSKRPHLQGTMIFKNPRYFNALKKIWPTMHLEKCRSIKHSIGYCGKEKTRNGETIEIDEKPKEKEAFTLTKEQEQEMFLNWLYTKDVKKAMDENLVDEYLLSFDTYMQFKDCWLGK